MISAGQTPCLICRRPVGDDAVRFPGFIPKEHSLHRFCDGAYHPGCFERSGEGKRVGALYRRFQEIFARRPAHETLDDADDWARDAFADLFKE